MKRNKQTPIVLVVLFLVSTIGVVDGAINLINNPGFESGTASWGFYTNGAGTFTAVPPGHEGSNAARLSFDSGASNIQLYQTGVTLEANTRYRLSFWAYSSTGHDMTVRLFKHVSPYTTYMPEYTANLGTGWLNFTHEFNSTGFSGMVSDGRLMFWFAPFVTAGDIYYIDDIRLEKVEADRSPPIVTGNTPTGTGVPVNTQITVTFNESMNQSSARSAFSTSPATTGSFAWSGNMMTFTNDSNLLPNTIYNVTVGTGAKDLAGNSLQSPYKWNFTTASVSDTSPPVVTGSTPTGTNVPVTTQITVTFNESMNKSSAQSAFSTLPGTTGSFAWSGNMMTMTYTPGSNLDYNTTYTVTVGTGAKDLAGNNMQSPNTSQFTTINASTLDARVTALETKLAAIEYKLSNVTRIGNDIYIDGANLHIRDGSGDTEGPTNGLGNLIIGYNELRGTDDNRTGSHNLIIGSRNNYLSFGGLVAGIWNTISGQYASVSGGRVNIASGEASSVSGGIGNNASGEYSSVSGGTGNTASGSYSSVSGGMRNTASGLDYVPWGEEMIEGVIPGQYNTASGIDPLVSGGDYKTTSGAWPGGSTWVGGGFNNTASGVWSSVSGGSGNIANADWSWVGSDVGASSVSGGYYNTASGWGSSVSGGISNIASGEKSLVGGGYNNTASGMHSSVSGGRSNTASGSYSSVSGGGNQDLGPEGQLIIGNTASGDYSWVSGGYMNTANGMHSSVSGGSWNNASGQSSSINGGSGNTAIGYDSSVSGGSGNEASGESSSVSGGMTNKAPGRWSSVSGGDRNNAYGEWSSVSGGYDNNASGEFASVSGGEANTASGYRSSVSGGTTNFASGSTSSVSGGDYNSASNISSSISGGSGNTASGISSSVSGGHYNYASGPWSWVGGGGYAGYGYGNAGNTASGEASSVSGGFRNTASGWMSSVSGGYYNQANGWVSSVSGGTTNTASVQGSSVSGGSGNTASNYSSSVSGGYNNNASGSYSSVSGGYLRNATGIYNWTAGGLSQDQ